MGKPYASIIMNRIKSVSLYDYQNSLNKKIKFERQDAKEEQAKKTATNMYNHGERDYGYIADMVGYTVDTVKKSGLALCQHNYARDKECFLIGWETERTGRNARAVLQYRRNQSAMCASCFVTFIRGGECAWWAVFMLFGNSRAARHIVMVWTFTWRFNIHEQQCRKETERDSPIFADGTGYIDFFDLYSRHAANFGASAVRHL